MPMPKLPSEPQLLQIWLNKVLKCSLFYQKVEVPFQPFLATQTKNLHQTPNTKISATPFLLRTSGRGGWFSRFSSTPRLDSVAPELHPEVSDEDVLKNLVILVELRYDIRWLSHPTKIGNFP